MNPSDATADLTSLERRSELHSTSRFRLTGLLGQGAMGIVYRAADSELGIDIALKTLPVPDPEDEYHLKQEFRSLADLKHPNLVDLYELIIEDGHCFFTMELLDGHDFSEFIGAATPRLGESWQGRLRGALQQLVAGIAALHASGRLHCDLKPSNILVTTEGRVVVLDFGLARALAPEASHRRAIGEFAGTFAYLPPDELYGAERTTASDWYSVGVILFELVTGKTPFADASPGMMILLRGREAPPRLRSIVPETPEWLDGLTHSLLASTPEERPKAAQILALLANSPEAASAPLGLGEAPVRGGLFIGRLGELRELRHMLDSVTPGRLCVAHVSGPSGIGKSELVRVFLRDATSRGTVVLAGRCHPQESVPFKALDGVIDDLSSYLLEPTAPELGIEDPHAASLLRLFPVLRRVPTLARAPAIDPGADAATVRRWGAETLRGILGRIAHEHPLAIWIDDLQWGDLDSLNLLRAALRSISTGVLLILSYRAQDSQQSPFLEAIARESWEIAPSIASTIALAPLSSDESQQLIRRLLPDREEAHLAALANEAQGSPFFAVELARSDQPLSSSLDALISHRLTTLPSKAQRLLELSSVAARPLPDHLVLQSAGLGSSARPMFAMLERLGLVKVTPRGNTRAIAAYHDRIRETVIARLDAGALRACHQVLAEVLAGEAVLDHDALFTHTLGAGDRAGAAVHASLAAARAADALAFNRAAHLYGQALELGAEDRPRICESLGEALINAGRGADAPPHFLEAARGRAADPGAAITLRRRAAEQLIRTGSVEEGTAIFHRVLADVRISMPTSSAAASGRTALGLLRLSLRGLDFQPRAEDKLSQQALLRLDARWGACGGLGMMNPTIGAALAIEYLLEALDAGEPSRVAYGLLYQAVSLSAIGGRFLSGRAASLLALGERLATGVGDPTLLGFAAFTRGSVAWHEGRFEEAARSCNEAIAIFETRCRGTAWHRVAAENYALSALAFLGDMRALSARAHAARSRADEQNDAFGAAIFRIGQLNMGRLADDAPEQAIAEADAITASWPLRLYHHTVITVQSELYRSDALAAQRRFDGALDGLQRERLFVLELPRIELDYLRARVALGVGATILHNRAAPAGTSLQKQARLAEGWAGKIERSALPPAAPFAASIRAGVAWLRGDKAATAAGLITAVHGFERARLMLHAETHRLGHLSLAPGRTGIAAASARDRIHTLGVRRPDRMTAMMLPFLPRLTITEEKPERAADQAHG